MPTLGNRNNRANSAYHADFRFALPYLPAASVFEEHLRNEPNTTSRRCVKRLRGIVRPQYPLRVGEVPRFYDVSGSTVEILAIVSKSEADLWLDTQVPNSAV